MREPIVACRLGRWYNKDAVLTYLLDAESFGDMRSLCAHIKKLKEVTELNLQRAKDTEVASTETDSIRPTKSDITTHNFHLATFVCPMTMKPMNGQYRFVFLRTCGHAFTEQAMKELSGKECYVVRFLCM